VMNYLRHTAQFGYYITTTSRDCDTACKWNYR
jgi:hypothetical protein